MAPEQLAGRDVDIRADLFALGVMLFELATGTRPWSGDNAITIAVAMATTPPRVFQSTGVPASFESVVRACLQLEPADRPQDAREIAEAISRGGDVDDHVLPVAPRITTSTRATPVTHAAEATSLAVLPISCASPDEYLADGILEDLIDALSSTPGLRVRPAGIVRTKTAEDPREVGNRLDVDHVVSASLRRVPTGLRVSARLIGVADGFQIWAHKAECSEAEVLAVADALARGIAAALSTRASVATRPTDPRAVDLYLRARAELRRFWGVHATAAADLLEQAAVFAPSSAPILGALAYASVLAWVMRGAPEMVERARVALERGLASGHGEAYLASASWLLNHGDHERGAADLANALIRAPMSAPTHEMTGRILIEVGFPVEARRHFETAIGLDPGRATIINSDLARLDALEGNWISADARVAKLRNDPDEAITQLGWVFEARLAGWRGNREAVLAAAKRYVPKMGDNATRMMDLVASSITDGVDAGKWTKIPEMYSGEDRPRRQQLLGLQLLSEMATVLGMHDVARDTLTQAVALGLIDTYWLGHCPLFVPFHDDSWFSEIRQGVADSASRVVTAFTAIAAL
jgi:serine/threonine-protein kinase